MLGFVLKRTPTNENNSGTEWRGIQQLLLSFGTMVRFIKLDVLFCLIDLGLRIWVYTCNTRATIISNEVQIPFHFTHFRISSVTDIIRIRAIIIKQQ